jgi:hypothetical protein
MRKALTVIALGLLLSTLISASYAVSSMRVIAADAFPGEPVDTGSEYVNATIGSPIDGLSIWYVWINNSYSQVIYLAYVSDRYPPPVLTFFGQRFMTGNSTEVFVGNTLTAMEVYNDTNGNGVPDVSPDNGTSELLYNFAVNSSQSFVITPVEKTLIGNESHYTWGLRYNAVDGFLLSENQAEGARVMVDYLASSYDFYVQNDASYLKTSFKIGKILSIASTSNTEVTLDGLSLSLLYGTTIVASKTYDTIVNGQPFNSTTTQNLAEPTQSGEIRIEDSRAYQCVFGQNYTLIKDSENVTYPSQSAAVSDKSVPGGLYRSVESTLSLFEDVLSGLFPKISDLPVTINLDYNVSSFLYRVFYPQWEGYSLEHDPIYIAYLTLTTVSEIGPPAIFVVGVAVAGSIALLVALGDVKKTRRATSNRSVSGQQVLYHSDFKFSSR